MLLQGLLCAPGGSAKDTPGGMLTPGGSVTAIGEAVVGAAGGAAVGPRSAHRYAG